MESTSKEVKISPKKEKNRRLAIAVLQPGSTYEKVGRELIPHALYPAQTVYSALKTKGVQAELRDLTSKYYDEEKLRKKLNEVLDHPQSQQIKLRAIELGMRERTMLIEKVEQATTILDKSIDLSKASTEDLESALLTRLKADNQGVRTAPVSTPAAQGEMIEAKAE